MTLTTADPPLPPGPTGGALKLAIALSVATRIEPELIRAVRLTAFPRLDVSAESDLWFSAWVGSRSPRAIALLPRCLPPLRSELTDRLRDETQRSAFLTARETIERAHSGLSPVLILEEQINWLTVTGDDANAERELDRALYSLVENGRTGIADWFAGAWHRLPDSVRQTRTAWRISAVTQRYSPSSAPHRITNVEPTLSDISLIAPSLGETRLGLRRDLNTLWLGEVAGPDAVAIVVPDTNPRVVEIELDAMAAHRHIVQIERGDTTSMEVGESVVRIRTGLGDLYELPAIFDIGDPRLQVVDRAIGAWQLARRSGQAQDVLEAVALLREARPRADLSTRPMVSSTLALALILHFELSGELYDLNEAINVLDGLVNETPRAFPDSADDLSTLGNALLKRFAQTGSRSDLDAAVDYLSKAVEALPADHFDSSRRLSDLGSALALQFGLTSDSGNLDFAISVFRQALAASAANNPDNATYQYNLGRALLVRYEQSGAQADLDAAVDLLQETAESYTSAPALTELLGNLGIAYLYRFELTGREPDLNRAVSILRQAVETTPQDHAAGASRLSNLGTALVAYYDRTGEKASLDESIAVFREAAASTPHDSPDAAGYLANLGSALLGRYQRTGYKDHLDEAIVILNDALEAAAADHPQRATYLMGAGAALLMRFERAGALADLDAAVGLLHDAVSATPTGSPRLPETLSSLGNALKARFERLRTFTDLTESVSLLRQAVVDTPVSHANRPKFLSSLSEALLTMSVWTGAADVLDEAVEAAREVVRTAPDHHFQRSAYLDILGTALRIRYERTDALSDLEAAIAVARDAVRAAPHDEPRRAAYLDNLGTALRKRYELANTLSDLEEAIAASQGAVRITPSDHPQLAKYFSSLGTALQSRYERTNSPSDLAAAARAFASAADVVQASPLERIYTLRTAARLFTPADPARAAELLRQAVPLLAEVAPHRLVPDEQRHVVEDLSSLPAEAAAMVLGDPSTAPSRRAEQALELLECGRSLFLAPVSGMPADLTELSEQYPDLAARLTALRDQLDQYVSPASQLSAVPLEPSDDLSWRNTSRRQAMREFEELIQEIRSQPGFENFLTPLTFRELVIEARQGAVVVFNICALRCDALVLTIDGVTVVPLPKLNQVSATARAADFQRALADSFRAHSHLSDFQTESPEIVDTLVWLWDVAVEPVLTALGHTRRPSLNQPWPRVWWIPGGPLNVLPIHAAGHHFPRADPAQRATIDRVISSYTPTIGALRYARRSTQPTLDRALIVSTPTTPGAPSLQFAWDESALVANKFRDSILLSATHRGETGFTAEPTDRLQSTAGSAAELVAEPLPLPTKVEVLNRLPRCNIVHFACHAVSDPVNPARSYLLLHDYPLTVADLAAVRLERADLAYLSACSTASVRNARLVDQAIHLTSAFQIAGYKHVIGTLWDVTDDFAFNFAKRFYSGLVTSGDRTKIELSALALHEAMRAVRERGSSVRLWASYVHAGA